MGAVRCLSAHEVELPAFVAASGRRGDLASPLPISSHRGITSAPFPQFPTPPRVRHQSSTPPELCPIAEMFVNISQAEKEAFFGLLDEYAPRVILQSTIGADVTGHNRYFATRGGVAAMTAAKSPAGQAAISRAATTATNQFKSVGGRFLGQQPQQPQHTGTSDTNNTSTRKEEEEESRPSFAALRGAFANAQHSPMGQSIAGSVRSMVRGTHYRDPCR